MNSKIQKFAEAMQKEIDDNSCKGDWENFTDKKGIWSEFFHHLNNFQ